jgi:hypothetical protein
MKRTLPVVLAKLVLSLVVSGHTTCKRREKTIGNKSERLTKKKIKVIEAGWEAQEVVKSVRWQSDKCTHVDQMYLAIAGQLLTQ